MPAIITLDDAGYAHDLVKAICLEVGPGLPGSSQERERAAVIARELESHRERNPGAAAARAGVPFNVRPATLGTGTDASPFSQAGLKATTLLPFKFPQQMVAFYHQKWDSPDVLTMEPLLNVLKVALAWVSGAGEDSK